MKRNADEYLEVNIDTELVPRCCNIASAAQICSQITNQSPPTSSSLHLPSLADLHYLLVAPRPSEIPSVS